MRADLPSGLAAALRFDRSGLIPAIAQDHASGEVLMLAWMNAESVAATLASGFATYWSRSRKALWRKGETSGHTQRLVEFRLDCDGDAILLRVEQTGPACHTGHRTCFFRAVHGGELVESE
jgi:phosphoribosyl-AMP cyclohydrolase